MSVLSIHLRTAQAEDQPLLEYWDQQAHVIASDPDDDWDWAKELAYDPPWREQLVAELDGHPLGFLQIIDPAEEVTHYWGEIEPHLRAIDIWIGAADQLGKGYGTKMMQLAIQRCFQDKKVKAILVDPLATNHGAHRFYERLGFLRTEERVFSGRLCYIYRLDRPKFKST